MSQIHVETEEALLDEIVSRLVKALDAEEIFLFGSRARGDHHEDSDYDLMVIVADDHPVDWRQHEIKGEALRDIPVHDNVLICTRTHFDERLHLKASIPSAVLRDGRLLYAADGVNRAGHLRQTPDESFSVGEGMPPKYDPVLVATTVGWLKTVELDLEFSQWGFDEERDYLLMGVLFHCQQAVEKSMKSFLIWHDIPIRKTHELEKVGMKCIAIDPTLEQVLPYSYWLAEWSIDGRYFDDVAHAPGRDKAKEALEQARAVYAAILERLPPQVHQSR